MGWLSLITFPLVVAIGLPQILGAVSAAVSARSVATWYKNDVRKPKWHPPLPLFGAIWPILYFFIGFASYIVYVEGMVAKRYAGPLTLYALQLALNVAWQPLFFEVRNWRLAQLDNIGTLIFAGLTGWSFYKVMPVAGWLFVPYIAFLVFANLLNFAVQKLNPNVRGRRDTGNGGRAPASAVLGASPLTEKRSASETFKLPVNGFGASMNFMASTSLAHKPMRSHERAGLSKRSENRTVTLHMHLSNLRGPRAIIMKRPPRVPGPSLSAAVGVPRLPTLLFRGP